MRGKMRLIWGKRKARYFLEDDWTGRNSLKRLGNWFLGGPRDASAAPRTVTESE